MLFSDGCHVDVGIHRLSLVPGDSLGPPSDDDLVPDHVPFKSFQGSVEPELQTSEKPVLRRSQRIRRPPQRLGIDWPISSSASDPGPSQVEWGGCGDRASASSERQ